MKIIIDIIINNNNIHLCIIYIYIYIDCLTIVESDPMYILSVIQIIIKHMPQIITNYLKEIPPPYP